MPGALWLIQSLLAFFFLGTGITKLTESRGQLVTRGMTYAKELPDWQLKAIGAIEVLAAIGLTVPAALHIISILMAAAASGLALLISAGMRSRLRPSAGGIARRG